MIPKLTPAQWQLLERLQQAHPSGVPVVEYYPPGQALVRLGLASSQAGRRFGGKTLHLTEAGATQLTERAQSYREATQRVLDDVRGRKS